MDRRKRAADCADSSAACLSAPDDLRYERPGSMTRLTITCAGGEVRSAVQFCVIHAVASEPRAHVFSDGSSACVTSLGAFSSELRPRVSVHFLTLTYLESILRLNAACAAAETVIRGPFALLVAAATFMKDFAAFREMARAVEHPASYPRGYGEREVDAEGRLGRRSAQNLGRVPGELCGAHLAPDHGTTVTPFACSPKKPSRFSAADWCRQASRKATFVTSVDLSRPK